MILLDTNIFIIDRFFKRDANYKANKRFVSLCRDLDAGLSIFSLLELCGIGSFNLSLKELRRWLVHFESAYAVEVLEPRADAVVFFDEWLESLIRGIIEMIERKMTFGDALLLKEAEGYDVEGIVTWNKKHFEGRTELRVFTPEEFLEVVHQSPW